MGLIRLGDVKRAQGDSKAALQFYEESLANDRKRAEADKANAQSQRDVTVDLDRIADTKRDAGDGVGALAAFEETLDIRRESRQGEPNDDELATHDSGEPRQGRRREARRRRCGRRARRR